MLRDPARVAVTPVSSTVERITQRIIQVDFSAKPAILAQLLKQEPVNRALVFTRTKHGADKVVKSLAKAGINANAIHGNKSQNHRERLIRIALPREDLRTPGHREAAPAAAQHRSGRPAPRPHAARANERANDRANESAGAAKGPRRRHRNGGKNGASPTHRQEPRRS